MSAWRVKHSEAEAHDALPDFSPYQDKHLASLLLQRGDVAGDGNCYPASILLSSMASKISLPEDIERALPALRSTPESSLDRAAVLRRLLVTKLIKNHWKTTEAALRAVKESKGLNKDRKVGATQFNNRWLNFVSL